MATINAIDFIIGQDWSENYCFPCRPDVVGTDPLETYYQILMVRVVFAYSGDSPKLLIHEIARSKNSSSIVVMCEREGRMCEREGFHPWLLVEITFVNGNFVHTKLGGYFDKDDVDEAFYIRQGHEWGGGRHV